jgi:hypothetical protein
MSALIEFLASTRGRGVRIIVGAVLILVGLYVIGGTAGVIVTVIGIIPVLAGAADVCLLAPLFKMPFSGKDIRSR